MESYWLRGQAITGNLVIDRVVHGVFIQNMNTFIITIFTRFINKIHVEYIISTNIWVFCSSLTQLLDRAVLFL